MMKINITDIVTDNATCSTINDMDVDVASYVAADVASYVANDVAANMADDVAISKKLGPLVVGFILILGN